MAASVAIAVLAAWSLWTLSAPAPLGNFSDSVDYLILAEFYAGHFGDGVAPQLVSHYAHSRFPPLFALALTSVGATPVGHLPGLALTHALAIAGAILFAAWYVREGVGARAAALLCLVAFATSAPLYLLLNVVSEPMLLALLGLALLLAQRPRVDFGSMLVLALVIGLAPMARMAAVAMVGAFGLWLIRCDRLPALQRAACFAVAALPALAWIGYRNLLPVEESYVAALTPERVLEGFGGWMGLFAQPLAVWRGLAAAFHPDPGAISHAAAGAILILAIRGLPARWRARSFDAGFTPLYVGLVLVWPYPAEVTRLMLVALPVLVLQAWVAARAIPWRAGAARGLPIVLGATLMVAAISGWQHTLHRMRLPLDADLAEQLRSPAFFLAGSDANAIDGAELLARLVALAKELPSVVADEDCVYTVFPSVAWVQSGRRTHARAIPNEVMTGRAPIAMLRECRYLLVANLHVQQFNRPALYPLDEVRAWTRPVLSSTFERNGKPVLAAALVEWVGDAPVDAPR